MAAAGTPCAAAGGRWVSPGAAGASVLWDFHHCQPCCCGADAMTAAVAAAVTLQQWNNTQAHTAGWFAVQVTANSIWMKWVSDSTAIIMTLPSCTTNCQPCQGVCGSTSWMPVEMPPATTLKPFMTVSSPLSGLMSFTPGGRGGLLQGCPACPASSCRYSLGVLPSDCSSRPIHPCWPALPA